MTEGKLANVDAYLAGFPPDVAFILERLRDTIYKAAPGGDGKNRSQPLDAARRAA